MFYKGKKVTVTGATGLVGANLVAELLLRGANVRGILHTKPAVIRDSRIEYLQCDLTRMDDCLKAAQGAEIVFNCSANTSGAVVMKNNPLAHITGNLLLNSQLLEAAYTQKVGRFFFMSSSTTYPDSEEPMKETDAFVGDPYETYFGVGWMKRYIEKLCEFYCRRLNMKIAVLRPTNIFGPYDKFDPATSHVLPALIRRAVEKQDPYEVWGDGTAERDFIYVSDIVNAMLIAVEKVDAFKPVNFATGEFVTIRQCVDLILKHAGHTKAKVIYDASKPTTIPKRRLDLALSRRTLGYSPQVSFEQGLKKTIDWYLSTLKPA